MPLQLPSYCLPRLLTTLLMCLLCAQISAQLSLPQGSWHTFVSHRQGRDVASRGSEVYAVTDAGLYFWNSETGESRAYTRLDGLSESSPQLIYYSEAHDYFFLSYASGRINYFREAGDFKSIPDLFIEEGRTSNNINEIYAHGPFVYFATDFGVVAYDIAENETRESYTEIGGAEAQRKTNSARVHEDRIWVVSEDFGLYSAPLDARNLQDPVFWRKEDGANGLPEGAGRFLALARGSLYVEIDGLIYMRDEATETWLPLLGRYQEWGVNHMEGNDQALFVKAAFNIFRFEGVEEVLPWVWVTNQPRRLDPQDNDRLYIAEGGVTLQAIDYANDTLLFQNEEGLPNNKAQDIAIENGQLYVGPDATANNFSASFDRSGIYYMNLDEREWRVLNAENGGLDSVRCNTSIGFIHFDAPNNTAYMSSFDYGINVLRDGELVGIYDTLNSCLTGVERNPNGTYDFIRPVGIDVDARGNLWVALDDAARSLTVFTADSACYAYDLPETPDDNSRGLEIDDFGYIWVPVRQQGIVLIDPNGTPETNADDVSTRVSTEQGRGALASGNVNVVKKDLEGAVWAGTATGVSVFYNPSGLLYGGGGDAICPVYNQRCLLQEEEITAIAVDGANRKWFGTSGGGVFLFNAEGNEQIHAFNTENSPLLSDFILDIDIDDRTGEVFFATENGIISYVSDATEGRPDNSKVTAYPNPVFRDYRDNVVIRGSANDSYIRITTASGQLVRELRSSGGLTLWDARDARGSRVSPGVYFILLADENGALAGKTKIAVLDRDQ